MTPRAEVAVSTTHELLVGLLARQLDLVKHDHLLTAWQVWQKDRKRQLTWVLFELEFISSDTRRLLEVLSRHHIAAHDNDVDESLAAVLALDGVPSSLHGLCALDPEIAPKLPPVMAMMNTKQVRVTPLESSVEFELPVEDPAQRYRILRPLAVGGVGSITLAEDSQLHREVALKEIQARIADDPVSRERFIQEAEITGQLEHPGVVPVYSLGMHADGRPFYTMRYVQGETFHAAIQRYHKTGGKRLPSQRKIEFRGLLTRFVAICEVVAYAHARGVIHRDVKPANVLLGNFGETLVVDWGLAKKLTPSKDAPAGTSTDLIRTATERDTTKTVMGQIVGTPAYMSPEQAGGHVDLMGPASDIYSLGATLYELLTGQAPFVTMSADMYLRIQRGEFPSPRQLKPDVPPALDAICRKALALKPADRYATAQELARDIERWLADAPVAVHTESLRERLSRWGRLHKVAIAEWTALVLTAIVALAINLYAMHQERVDRRQAQADLDIRTQELNRERARSETAAMDLRENLDILAEALIERGDHVRASRVAEDLVQLTRQPADSWRAAVILAQCSRLTAKEPETASEYGRRAVDHLRAAIHDGHPISRPLQSEPQFAPLRARPDFQELVRRTSPSKS